MESLEPRHDIAPAENEPEPARDNGIDFVFPEPGANEPADSSEPDAALEEDLETLEFTSDDFTEADAEEDAGEEDEFGFLSEADEAATKLDLARAYIDMGDKDGAREILEEVLQEGNEAQVSDAQRLLERV